MRRRACAACAPGSPHLRAVDGGVGVKSGRCPDAPRLPLVEELFIIVVLGLVVLLRLVGLDLGVRLRARRARGLRAVSFCLPVRAIDGLYCIIHILYYSVVGQRTPRIA